jgi:hypothetical protein
VEDDACSRVRRGHGNPHGSLTRHRFTWERERYYRQALRRIVLSPTSKTIEQREFDDQSRVLRVLISGKLHEFLTGQMKLIPEAIRAIAGTRAYRRIAASEDDLASRFSGSDPRCVLIDTLDVGFFPAEMVPAILAIYSDSLIACRLEEIQLGSGFVTDRIRINAELMAARIKE